jgi:hypothetical protein
VTQITLHDFADPLNLCLDMGDFSVLTNRKRALVALVHSVFFLLIAFRQMVGASPAVGILVPAVVSPGTWILCLIFLIVSAILLWLFAISRGAMEKLYFGMCAVSATSGLLRTAAGDHAFHIGLYIRVVMLASAVLVGLLIFLMHTRMQSRMQSDCALDS